MSKIGIAQVFWKHEHMSFSLFGGGTTLGTSLSVVHLGKRLGANGLQCIMYNVQGVMCNIQCTMCKVQGTGYNYFQ